MTKQLEVLTGLDSLKLNDDKTEALLAGCCRKVSMSQDNHLRVDNHDISLKSYVKTIWVYTDATLSMEKYIDHASRSAYLEIRRISSPPSPDDTGQPKPC